MTPEALRARLKDIVTKLPPHTSMTWTPIDGTGIVELALWGRNGYTFAAVDTDALETNAQLLDVTVASALRRLA